MCLFVGLWVCLFVCLMSPFHVIFFEASHWSSDHMTRSWPLISQPSFPTIVVSEFDALAVSKIMLDSRHAHLWQDMIALAV